MPNKRAPHPLVQKLKEIREQQRLTQLDVAERMAIHQQALSRSESTGRVSLETLDRWTKALGYRVTLAKADEAEP